MGNADEVPRDKGGADELASLVLPAGTLVGNDFAARPESAQGGPVLYAGDLVKVAYKVEPLGIRLQAVKRDGVTRATNACKKKKTKQRKSTRCSRETIPWIKRNEVIMTPREPKNSPNY